MNIGVIVWDQVGKMGIILDDLVLLPTVKGMRTQNYFLGKLNEEIAMVIRTVNSGRIAIVSTTKVGTYYITDNNFRGGSVLIERRQFQTPTSGM